MGRLFERDLGGLRGMAESLLRAAAPLCERQNRTIEVLVPRKGLCPVRSRAIVEVHLPLWRSIHLTWDHWTVPMYARWRKKSVLFNMKQIVPWFCRTPAFPLLYDMTLFPQRQKYPWREYRLADTLYMGLAVRRAVRRAPLSMAVSEAVARDARELFSEVDPGRFRVIHPGIELADWAPHEWTARDREAWEQLHHRGLHRPYVFYSGTLGRRKNVAVLAKAFARFNQVHPNHQLVLTGGAGNPPRDKRLADAIVGIEPRSFLRLGKVDQRTLRLLYQKASFLVYPSLHEGFALPPLEAQAADCPVICSNASSLAETMGESAMLFDPNSPRELLECMERMAEAEVRRDYVGRGRRNVERFSWDDTARAWLELADEVYAAGLVLNAPNHP